MKKAKAKLSQMRRFVLNRKEDETGTSGTGVVAEGIQFSNGQVSLHWLSQHAVVSTCDNMTVVETLHGHDGKTEVVWIDK